MKFHDQADLLLFLRDNLDIVAKFEAIIRRVEVELPIGERNDEEGYGNHKPSYKRKGRLMLTGLLCTYSIRV
jgi:hypothetical protein